jgi:hypothetical protein
MTTLKNTLEGLKVDKKETYENLTMFPLTAGTEPGLDYLTLGQALEAGLARVSEVSKGGSVPELRFANSAELPVLIVDGEELVGAKQNRVANLTVLTPAKTTIQIPVSCVEAGRWRYQRDDFIASEQAHFALGRAVKVGTVSAAMACGQAPRSDQGRIWSDIEAKAERMHAASPTRAMSAIYERHTSSVEQYVRAFPPSAGQIGAVFAIGDDIVGLDLFDRPSTFAALLPKLIRSYAVDALETANRDRPGPKRALARAFLDRAADAQTTSYPAIGLGTDIRLSAPGLVGGGLLRPKPRTAAAAWSGRGSGGARS